MKKFNFLLVVFAFLVVSLMLVGCKKTTTTTTTKPTSTTTTKSEQTPTTTKTTSTTEPGVELVISVVPAEMELYAGEEIDLLFGVSVNDNEASLIITDDSDFDADTPGEYIITYRAALGDASTTATRKVTVLKALSNLALEVQKNLLGEVKWQGNLLSFAHALYVELSESSALPKASGVYHNASEAPITLSVEGSYGVAAVIDANGKLVEGRDGANSRLVNAENPLRASSSVSTLTINEESVTVASAFAQGLVIPAKGFAIIVQANYCGTTVDSDGRSFMNYNVIYSLDNVVRLYWVDDNTELTSYVNQKPVVSGNSKILVNLADASFDFNTKILEGITATDDNATFTASDNTTISEITVVNNGGFDVNKAGVYTVSLSVTDGTLTTEFTREVEVKSEGLVTLKIGEQTFNVAKEFVAIDEDLAATGSLSFIIFTDEYTGELNVANGYGIAVVVNNYGEIVRAYDGANNKYFDKDNTSGVVDNNKCTSAGYMKEAFDSLQEGETLIIAPNSSTNNAEGGSRKWLLSNGRSIGAVIEMTDLIFDVITDDKEFTVNSKTFTAVEGKWLYNTAFVAADCANYQMIILDKAFDGEFTSNGYGAAIVIDKYGVLVKLYDGANVGYYTKEGKAASAHFTTSTFASVAFTELEEGETLIIFPNDGAGNAARAFALGLRTDGSIGTAVTLTGKEFEEKVVNSITIGEKSMNIDVERVAVNTTTSTVTDYDFYIFTTEFNGTLGFANGYGEAFVVKDGKVVRIYDGANGKYYDSENLSGVVDALKTTASTYLNDALKSLSNNEWLLVAPHDGGANVARAFLTGCRTIGSDVAIDGVTVNPVDKAMKSISVGTKTFYTTEVAYNQEVTDISKLDFAIYSHGYNGVLLVNGWSEAFVFDSLGKIVRIYDGVNNKYYDAENTSGIARTDSMYLLNAVSKYAFESLQAGETMVVGLNGGLNGNKARAFFVSNRSFGADLKVSGVDVQASETLVTYNKITVKGKVYYADSTKVAIDSAFVGAPMFAIYTYGYEGERYTGSYGVAFIVDEATGKVVKIFDGASAKYFDSENPGGVTGSLCTAAGYAQEAFDALAEGQYVLIAPNGGSTGNVARALLYSNRVLDTAVSYE